jgi:Holliday junction resolvase RusA-like endonuclease
MLLTIKGYVPSKKNSKQIWRNRRTNKPFVVSSDAWHSFENDALNQLKKQWHGKRATITKDLAVDITFLLRGKRKADIDNKLSGIFDLLQMARILKDDDQIVTVTARKYKEQPEDITEINLMI